MKVPSWIQSLFGDLTPQATGASEVYSFIKSIPLGFFIGLRYLRQLPRNIPLHRSSPVSGVTRSSLSHPHRWRPHRGSCWVKWHAAHRCQDLQFDLQQNIKLWGFVKQSLSSYCWWKKSQKSYHHFIASLSSHYLKGPKNIANRAGFPIGPEVMTQQIHSHFLVGKPCDQCSSINQGMKSTHGNTIQEPGDCPICIKHFKGDDGRIGQCVYDATFAARFKITRSQLPGHQIWRCSTEANTFLEEQSTTQILTSISSKSFQRGTQTDGFSRIQIGYSNLPIYLILILQYNICFSTRKHPVWLYDVFRKNIKTFSWIFHPSPPDLRTSISPPGIANVLGKWWIPNTKRPPVFHSWWRTAVF